MDELIIRMNDKIDEYNKLKYYMGKVMADPYHQYDELQLGHESLTPILIRPDAPGVNYNDLVQAELKVGLEGILSSIRDFFAKIVKWIRDRIVAAYRWIINASDDIQREVVEIKKNTPSEIHNRLIRAGNQITESGKEFNDEFYKLIADYTVVGDLQIYKINEETRKLAKETNRKLANEGEIVALLDFKNKISEQMSRAMDNLLTGTIYYRDYRKEQEKVWKKYGGLDDKSTLKYKGVFNITGKKALETDIKLNLTYSSKKVGDTPVNLLSFNDYGETVTTDIPTATIVEEDEYTVDILSELENYEKIVPVKANFEDPSDDILHINFPKNEIIFGPSYDNQHKKDGAYYVADYDLDTLHLNMLKNYVTFHSKLIAKVDTVLIGNIRLIKDTYKANTRLMREITKEYAKSLSKAEDMIKSIRKQKE